MLGLSAISINPTGFSSLVPRLFGKFRDFNLSAFPTKIPGFFVACNNRDFVQIFHCPQYQCPGLSETKVFIHFREYGGINQIIFSIIFVIFCFSTALGAKRSF